MAGDAVQGFVAEGTIYPCRFVKLVSGKPGRVAQCGSGDRPFGVSQMATRLSPLLESQGRAALDGEPIGVFDLNSETLLEAGGTVSVGDALKPDSQGRGVTAGAGEEYGALALEAGVSGRYIRVKVVLASRA